MTDKSFLRFGGLAGILLALTSWATVVVFYVVVPEAQRVPIANASEYLTSLAQNSFGSQLYNGLYALIAVWAFIGIVAMYFRMRSFSESWTFFATLLAGIAAFMTILNGLQQVATVRFLAATFPSAKDFALAALPTRPRLSIRSTPSPRG